jgi:hypothetical protein
LHLTQRLLEIDAPPAGISKRTVCYGYPDAIEFILAQQGEMKQILFQHTTLVMVLAILRQRIGRSLKNRLKSIQIQD